MNKADVKALREVIALFKGMATVYDTLEQPIPKDATDWVVSELESFLESRKKAK